MKSSRAGVHKKQDGSDFNRGRRSGRWGLNVTERSNQALEISVRRLDRPIVEDIKTRSSIYLQAAEKLADTAHVLARTKRLIGQSKQRQRGIPLPPISGSRSITGKVERTEAPPAHRHSTHLLTGNMMAKNTVFHLLVTQGRKLNQDSSKHNKISVALAAGNKAAIQDSDTRSRLIKRTFDGQPAATSTSATADPPIRQKSDSRTMMPIRAKHDASLCEARRQRDFCSDDSAIETESEGSEDKGRLERLSDDEYYTDQRITEWVLKVNSSLFSTGNDELKRSKPSEEQDVATIKIIYSGESTF